MTETQIAAIADAARAWKSADRALEPDTTSAILDGGAYDDLLASALGVESLYELPIEDRHEAWRIVRRIYDEQ